MAAALGERGAAELPDDELIAPPLGWSEATSVLHETAWRRERGSNVAREALRRLDDLPVIARAPRGLRAEAWRIADELGWAKTYDAEYLALARINGCRVVTLDARLVRGTARLGLVIGWPRR